MSIYRGADKSLAWPGRKQSRKHVRNMRDFNNIKMQAVTKLFFLQGKAPKEIHTILTETVCFLPGRAKDLSVPLYCSAEIQCVCVCARARERTSTSLNACMAHTGTTLQIPDCTENTDLDSCLKSGFYTLTVQCQLASAIPGHK